MLEHKLILLFTIVVIIAIVDAKKSKRGLLKKVSKVKRALKYVKGDDIMKLMLIRRLIKGKEHYLPIPFAGKFFFPKVTHNFYNF